MQHGDCLENMSKKNDFQSRRVKLTDDEKAKAHEKRLAPVYFVEVRKKGIIEKKQPPKRKIEEEKETKEEIELPGEDGKSKKKLKKEDKKKKIQKKRQKRQQKI